MNKLLLLVVSSFFLSSCAFQAATPQGFLSLPKDKISEIDVEVDVPVNVAHRNFLVKARECWHKTGRVVDADHYDKNIGYARISVRFPKEIFHSGLYLTIVDFEPLDGKTKVHGISQTALQYDGLSDFPNFKQWAEGKDAACL